LSFKPEPKKKDEGTGVDAAKGLRLAKSTLSIGESLQARNPEKALHQVMMAGLKMASAHPFADSLVSPITLALEIKKLGIAVLGWTPETLMATIDQNFNHWTSAQVHDALEYFHKSGVLKTDVPQLVREKIYAIRVIATSNSAQTEWQTFEKVGGAFNDRLAKFGAVEALTPGECARTVAIIENIRPDTYENEVKVYIAACCHAYGLLTVSPVKWLAFADPYLQKLNQESTGEQLDPGVVIQVTNKMAALKDTVHEVEEDVISIQAAKLLAIDYMAEEATSESAHQAGE
jgi:hypothetical protein